MKIRKTMMMDGKESLSKALNSILKSGTAVVVLKNKRYYGIVDDRHLKTVVNAAKTKVESVAIKAPLMPKNAEIKEVLQLFLSGHFKALPVYDEEKKKITGIVSRSDVLEELYKRKLIHPSPVVEHMNSPVYTIDVDENLGKAKKMMKENKVHRLLVTEKGRPYGTISTFDLAVFLIKPKEKMRKTLIKEKKNPADRKIKEVVRNYILTIDHKKTLMDAAKKMAKEEHSSAVVMANKKPVGVISATDIFKLVLEEIKKEKILSINGLSEDDMLFYDDVRTPIENMLKKMKKSIKITKAELHIKKKKSVYKGDLHIHTNKKPIIVHYEDHSLEEMTAGIVEELKAIFRKLKTKKKVKKKVR